MPYTTAAKNLMLDALAERAVYVSLHDGDPGASGANELAGGSPAYARKAITWRSAAGGEVVDDSAPLVFDVPAGATVTHVGLWSAAVGGTFYGADDVTPEAYAGQGRYELDTYTLKLT